jgi:hypothetical protein
MWSASPPGCFTARENPPALTEQEAGTAGLQDMEKEALVLAGNRKIPRLSSHCTELLHRLNGPK